MVDDARRAHRLAMVRGATTNPVLLAATARPAEAVLADIADSLAGTVFFQLTGLTVEEREAEARRIVQVRPGRIGLKVPCTTDNLALVARLVDEGFICGMTAIFSPAQVLLAAEVGAAYVFPYVNRTTRMFGDGVGLVREMRQIVDATGAAVKIVAASVKTPEEAVATIVAGAHGLTLPIAVLEALGEHAGSVQMIEEFGAVADTSARSPTS